MILALILLSVIIVGNIFSQILLYIYNKTCYFIINIFIHYGNNEIQKEISKLLGA